MFERIRPFFLTSLWTILGRSASLVIPFFIAYWYGATQETDAFFMALGIVMALVGLFTPIFESILVPYLAEEKKDPARVSGLTNQITFRSLPLVCGVALLLWLLLPPLLKRFSGLEDLAAHQTGQFFIQLLPFLIFSIWVCAANGIFYTYQVFWFPAFSPLVRSMVILGVAFLTHERWGVSSLVIGYGAGEILRWLTGIFLLKRHSRWHFRATSPGSEKKVRDFFSQAGYQLLALLASGLIPLTDQWFASWFGNGRLTLMSYADRLFQIPYQLVIASVLQIFLSRWSETYFEKSPESFWRQARRHMAYSFWITLAFSAIAILGRSLLIRWTFGLGKMPVEDLRILEDLFLWMMVGFAPTILTLLYSRVLFVLKKSSVFCAQAWLRFVLNILLNAIFMNFFGLKGIAMATVLVNTVAAIWVHFYLKKQLRVLS